MSRAQRDSQRSRVYAWEARAAGNRGIHSATMKTSEECAAFLAPIWSAERGRMGRAGVPMPEIARPHRGQTRALAHTHSFAPRISLPVWSRNPWVILHEAAHHLSKHDEAHGPRFVGCLIGLLARHDGRSAGELMALADEMGVRYHVRTIGSVPVHGLRWQLERAVQEQRPMTEMDLACWLDCSYLQVRGAALGLIRAGTHRWLRGKLVSTAPPPPRRPPAPPGPGTATALAKAHGISIEQDGRSWIVWPPKGIEERGKEDPFEGDHYATSWGDVDLMVRRYVEILTGEWPKP